MSRAGDDSVAVRVAFLAGHVHGATPWQSGRAHSAGHSQYIEQNIREEARQVLLSSSGAGQLASLTCIIYSLPGKNVIWTWKIFKVQVISFNKY